MDSREAVEVLRALQAWIQIASENKALREQVRRLIEQRGSLTVAQLRDELGITRKYALAVLEYFDQTGFTRREGDARVLA